MSGRLPWHLKTVQSRPSSWTWGLDSGIWNQELPAGPVLGRVLVAGPGLGTHAVGLATPSGVCCRAVGAGEGTDGHTPPSPSRGMVRRCSQSTTVPPGTGGRPGVEGQLDGHVRTVTRKGHGQANAAGSPARRSGPLWSPRASRGRWAWRRETPGTGVLPVFSVYIPEPSGPVSPGPGPWARARVQELQRVTFQVSYKCPHSHGGVGGGGGVGGFSLQWTLESLDNGLDQWRQFSLLSFVSFNTEYLFCKNAKTCYPCDGRAHGCPLAFIHWLAGHLRLLPGCQTWEFPPLEEAVDF